MIKGLDLGVTNYKLEHTGFPDESTADQFFDEEQFEAYRVLGYDIASRMIEDERLPSTISDGRNVTLQGLLDELFGVTPTGSPPDFQVDAARGRRPQHLDDPANSGRRRVGTIASEPRPGRPARPHLLRRHKRLAVLVPRIAVRFLVVKALRCGVEARRPVHPERDAGDRRLEDSTGL